jgi:hypothetical protein
VEKSLLVLLLSIFTFSTSAQALSWAYSFVVWKGKVYEVKDEILVDSQIGGSIGEVETWPNEMTGEYYGNASNVYPIGTKYFKVLDLPTSSAIAVEVGQGQWLKAVYTHDAPFHWRDLFTFNLLIWLLVSIAVIIGLHYRRKRTF